MVVSTSALLRDAIKRFMLRKAYQHRLETFVAPVFPALLMLTAAS